MQQWLRSYTLYIHTTYAYILHTIHLVLVTFTVATSGVWSTHQVFLKGPIGHGDDLLRSYYMGVRYKAVTIYTGV